MVGETEPVSNVGESTGEPTPGADNHPTIIDRRRNRRLYEQLDNWTPNPSVNANRIPNAKFPLGEEPWSWADGTHPDDPTVNLKFEVVEHPDPDPDQRHLLGGGPMTKAVCEWCDGKMHVGASMKVEDVLKQKYTFPEDYEFPDVDIVALVCDNGHVMQFRGDLLHTILE